MASKDAGALTIWRLRLGHFVRFMGRLTHYGFVPLILWLGVSLGQTEPDAPEITLRSFLWQ